LIGRPSAETLLDPHLQKTQVRLHLYPTMQHVVWQAVLQAKPCRQKRCKALGCWFQSTKRQYGSCCASRLSSRK